MDNNEKIGTLIEAVLLLVERADIRSDSQPVQNENDFICRTDYVEILNALRNIKYGYSDFEII